MSAAEQTAQGGAESLAVIGSRGARPRPLDLSPSAVCPLTQLHPYALCCPPPSVCPPSHVPRPAVGSSSACSAGIPSGAGPHGPQRPRATCASPSTWLPGQVQVAAQAEHPRAPLPRSLRLGGLLHAGRWA